MRPALEVARLIHGGGSPSTGRRSLTTVQRSVAGLYRYGPYYGAAAPNTKTWSQPRLLKPPLTADPVIPGCPPGMVSGDYL